MQGTQHSPWGGGVGGRGPGQDMLRKDKWASRKKIQTSCYGVVSLCPNDSGIFGLFVHSFVFISDQTINNRTFIWTDDMFLLFCFSLFSFWFFCVLLQ